VPAPSRTDADQLSEKILGTVVDLMREGGLGAVTTEAVAAAASVSKSSIYRRWQSMGELVAEAAAHAFPEIAIPDLGDTTAELRHFLTERVRQYSTPGAARLVASLIGAAVSHEHVTTFFNGWVDAQSLSSRAVFERAIERGELDPSSNVDDLRTIMSAPIMFRAVAEHGQPDGQLVETILGVLQASMTVPARS
jgi:AcrR family transcriptional regulator